MSGLANFLSIFAIEAPFEQSSSGAGPSDISGTFASFQQNLGGVDHIGDPTAFDDGFRSIDWDGISPAAVDRDPNTGDLLLFPEFFNADFSPLARGIEIRTFFVTPIVSAASTDPPISDLATGQPVQPPVEFGGLNSTYPNEFIPFSSERLFASQDDNVFNLFFFVPGTETPATVNAFGAVFADVDLPGTSQVEFFGVDGELLFQGFVPTANQGLSFLGATLADGLEIAQVRITAGNVPFGETENPAAGLDVVALDDFLYSEPQAIDTSNAPPDAAGNTLSGAQNLGLLGAPQAIADFVGFVDPEDFYSFTLNAPNRVSALVDGLDGDVDLQLIQDLNGNGEVDDDEVLTTSDEFGTTPDSFDVLLNSGSYFVRVNSFGSGSNYNLTLSATPGVVVPPDNAGNSLATANNIGPLVGTASFSDFSGAIDTSDIYSFTLAATSNVNIALDGLSADIDVQLIQDINGDGEVGDDEVLGLSQEAGNASEAIAATLIPGNYFVEVFPFAGETTYELNISATPV